jgi:hypothetical protein
MFRGSTGCVEVEHIHYLHPGATPAAEEQIPLEAGPAAVVQVRQKATKAAVERIIMADGMFNGK